MRSEEIHEWWVSRPDELYWLEVTGRPDIGANLKAPQRNEHGNPFWSYSLLRCVRPDDVIIHYDRNRQAIVAVSQATGQLWEDNLIWAARGTYARTAGIQPHSRLGWYVGLEGFRLLPVPLSLEAIRSEKNRIVIARDLLLAESGDPLYFPFELGNKRSMRPVQGYLFKLPKFFVNLFPSLFGEVRTEKLIDTPVAATTSAHLGSTYRLADEQGSVGERDPFSVDPALVERGLRGHATTQNSLANYVKTIGCEPRSPRSGEPNFDLAWKDGQDIWVAEVKSLTNKNEEKQLRLGLGQVLRYGHLLGGKHKVHLVLAVERQPSDKSWIELCSALGISLVWPSNWESINRIE